MAKYDYIAVKKNGERTKGQVEASDENEVRTTLRAQGLRPIRIHRAAGLKAGMSSSFLALTGRIGESEILLFSRQLSILIGAGIPLVQGLEIISTQVPSQAMKTLVLSVKEKVSSGSFLWESLGQYPVVFSDLYVNMVKAGEASGALDIILKRVMRYLEDTIRLKKLVKSAMVYPIAVTIIGIGVLILMLTFVIPKFEEMLTAQGTELPGPTQLVINMSHFCRDNIAFIFGTTAVVIVVIRRYLKSEEGKNFFDYFAMKLPLFGALIQKVAVARFSRTMQTMLSSGINLLDSIEICRGAVGNRIYGEAMKKVRSQVETGQTLSNVLQKNPLFPSMMVQMVTVGETTGNLDSMLEKVADFYEEEVTNTVSNMTKLMEPFIIVFLGGMVAGLMVAMYLPIFKMGG